MRCCLQIAAFLPAKGKFVPDEEEELARPKGALQDPSISLANPKKVRTCTVAAAALWHARPTAVVPNAGVANPAHAGSGADRG